MMIEGYCIIPAEVADPKFVAHLLMTGLALLFLAIPVKAVRTGQITPTSVDRTYLRAKEPGIFWFHVVAWAVVVAGFVAAAISPSLILLGIGTLLTYFVANDIRIGKIKPSIHDRIYTRSENPGTYWFHILINVVIACVLLALVLRYA